MSVGKGTLVLQICRRHLLPQQVQISFLLVFLQSAASINPFEVDVDLSANGGESGLEVGLANATCQMADFVGLESVKMYVSLCEDADCSEQLQTKFRRIFLKPFLERRLDLQFDFHTALVIAKGTVEDFLQLGLWFRLYDLG